MQTHAKTFHNSCEQIRSRLHVVLVRPEDGRNLGASARAIANMGILGSLRVVGNPEILKDKEPWWIAKHAANRLKNVLFYSSLDEALHTKVEKPVLVLGATARVGSPKRPHPISVRSAVSRALQKVKMGEVASLLMVFGPEGSGLTNEDISQCDWVVTVPSDLEFRSLNLAQTVLIFCYEANMCLLSAKERLASVSPNQKQKLISHIISLAEEVGFIGPGDPFKMRPRLEDILSRLPNHIKEIKTLHGLIEQIRWAFRKRERIFENTNQTIRLGRCETARNRAGRGGREKSPQGYPTIPRGLFSSPTKPCEDSGTLQPGQSNGLVSKFQVVSSAQDNANDRGIFLDG